MARRKQENRRIWILMCYDGVSFYSILCIIMVKGCPSKIIEFNRSLNHPCAVWFLFHCIREIIKKNLDLYNIYRLIYKNVNIYRQNVRFGLFNHFSRIHVSYTFWHASGHLPSLNKILWKRKCFICWLPYYQYGNNHLQFYNNGSVIFAYCDKCVLLEFRN